MLTRFISWLAIAIVAAFLVVVTNSFTSLSAIVWLAFGVSIGTLVVSAGIAYAYRETSRRS
jgi:formate hydrogenlyase subunit 3/multisubunit Na+/H+ antiporter MnhD subunit